MNKPTTEIHFGVTNLKRYLLILCQIVLFSAIAMGGEWFVHLIHLKLSGSILGMIVLFLLLKTGVVKLRWFEEGAEWMHARLVLFFVPSAVGICQYGGLLRTDGLSLLAIIVASTLAVMALTGISAQFLGRRKGRG